MGSRYILEKTVVTLLLFFACAAASAQPPWGTGFTLGAEVGVGVDSFSWDEEPPVDYSIETDTGLTVVGAVEAGAWLSSSLRLLAQVPFAAVLPGQELRSGVTALLPGVQVSYHFPDSAFYVLADAGWIWTFNREDEAGSGVASGPVFGGGVGYWLNPNVSIKAEGAFSSAHTNENDVKTNVRHLIVWASLCLFR